MLPNELDSIAFYDNLLIEIEPMIVREIVLDLLKDLKKGLRQLIFLSRKSIEYKLLLFDIKKKIEEAKTIISAIIGNNPRDYSDELEESSPLYNFNQKSNLRALIKMIELTEEKLNRSDIIEALAFFLALYEEIMSNFCDHCIFDAG